MNTATAPIFATHDSLHALHDASVSAERRDLAPAMALALAGSFGSVEHWCGEFGAMARALGDNEGWLLLVFVERTGMLVNRWAGDPVHARADGTPILAFDLDDMPALRAQGGNVDAHIEGFIAHIDWDKVYARYQEAVHAATDALAVESGTVAPARSTIVDVRRSAMFEQAATMLPGARWRDPAHVADWATELPPGQDVLVYCVYGHEVGRATALKLRALGVPARFIAGGIDGWTQAGLPLSAKSAAQDAAKESA